MAIRLDHTIIPSIDGEQSARWLSQLFGLADSVESPGDHLSEIITKPSGG